MVNLVFTENEMLGTWTMCMTNHKTLEDELALYLLCRQHSRHAIIFMVQGFWMTPSLVNTETEKELCSKFDVVLMLIGRGRNHFGVTLLQQTRLLKIQPNKNITLWACKNCYLNTMKNIRQEAVQRANYHLWTLVIKTSYQTLESLETPEATMANVRDILAAQFIILYKMLTMLISM